MPEKKEQSKIILNIQMYAVIFEEHLKRNNLKPLEKVLASLDCSTPEKINEKLAVMELVKEASIGTSYMHEDAKKLIDQYFPKLIKGFIKMLIKYKLSSLQIESLLSHADSFDTETINLIKEFTASDPESLTAETIEKALKYTES